MPEVSVVIPTRDRGRLLALTLRSVRWQRGVDLEVLVVDDGSSDDRFLLGRWEPGPLEVDDFLVKVAVRLHRSRTPSWA
jgi:hypothetical protein